MRRAPLIWGGAIALACLAGFFELAEDFAVSTAVMAFDVRVSSAVQAWRAPTLTTFFYGATIVGNVGVMTAITVVTMLALWWRRRGAEALLLGIVVGAGALISTFVKRVTERPRPDAANAIIEVPASFSFPSGHSMASLLYFGVLAYLALRRTSWPSWAKALSVGACIAAAVTIGLSRVYLGVHWPSDVLASWLLGGAWLAVALGVFESLQPASTGREAVSA